MALEMLVEQLKTIPDWRRSGRKVQYPLWLMLLTSLLGVMSGYTSLRGLADFMERHQQEVTDYFGLTKKKLPKYSTLRRMVHQIDGEQVAKIFYQWARQNLPVEVGEAIAIDGKALASTLTDCYEQQQDFVTVVSACVHQHGWVIGQMNFHNGQSSEIVSVRELIEQLSVKGTWLTLTDNCQKKTVSKILKSDNHYCIGLKGNQPNLLQQAQHCAQSQTPLSRDYAVLDTSHSRLVERSVEVFAAPESD